MAKNNMKTVGIVTINDKKGNYGNKLQNFASVYIIKRMGFKAITLLTEAQYDTNKIRLKRFINKLTGCRLSASQSKWERICNFADFDKKYLKTCNWILADKSLNELEYFLLGSDQVWNPEWYDDIKKKAFLLTFAEDKQKVCMSPSFGISTLPEEWREYFAGNLKKFKNLSVREKTGAEIIKELTGREAEVLIDPTMMLEANIWRGIEKKSKYRDLSKAYILKYFLGGETEKGAKYIEKTACENGLEIIDINRFVPDLCMEGPAEFLYLIDNAELICTDSFHACVFSILFDKPFLVFDRKGKYESLGSRIEGLLRMLGLDSRLPGAVSEKDVFEYDYYNAYKLLEKERKKAYSFLKMSLNIN